MPEGFDYMKRGDAFAFLMKVPKSFARIFVFVLMASAFGRKFFSNKNIGVFTRAADYIKADYRQKKDPVINLDS
jgi:hypothetical protein